MKGLPPEGIPENRKEAFYPDYFPICGCAKPGMRLGVSERRHAKLCKVSEEKYLQDLIDRAEEIKIKRDPTRREEKKIEVLHSTDALLIIGGGSSVTWENLYHVKNFNGRVMTCEISFRYLLALDIIPDYAMTLELAVDEVHLPKDDMLRKANKTVFVGSSLTRPNLLARVQKHGLKTERYITSEEPRLSNVGLFAIHYAKTQLNPDKICLLGFEHAHIPNKYYPQHTYDEWVADFWHYVDQWPADLIVNCSNGGVLYGDKILDGTWPLEVMCE